jgi:hypothetical protein
MGAPASLTAYFMRGSSAGSRPKLGESYAVNLHLQLAVSQHACPLEAFPVHAPTQIVFNPFELERTQQAVAGSRTDLSRVSLCESCVAVYQLAISVCFRHVEFGPTMRLLRAQTAAREVNRPVRGLR